MSHADGMHNVLTGLGDPMRDKATAGQYAREPKLSSFVLDSIYEQEGIAAKMVDLPADELVREGFELDDIEGVNVGDIYSACEDLQVLPHMADLHRWGDHYGGALLIAAVDDGMPAYMPLDLERVNAVRGFFVLDRWALQPITDGRRPPEGYRIVTADETPLGETLVHASRVRRHAGVEVTMRRQADHEWWGVPVMQRVWSRLRSLLSAYGYGENILQDVSVDVFMLNGIVEAFKQGKEDLVRRRLATLQMGKSIIRGFALDNGTKDRAAESYIPQNRSVSGIHELIELFLQAFVSAGPLPRSILLGETVGGLNTGTNSGEHRAFYARLSAEQNRWGTSTLNWMLDLILAAKTGPTGGKRPESWTTKWRPLMQSTPSEEADVRLKRLQGDKVLVDLGAASGVDVRVTRMEHGGEGELEAIEEPEDDPLDLVPLPDPEVEAPPDDAEGEDDAMPVVEVP